MVVSSHEMDEAIGRQMHRADVAEAEVERMRAEREAGIRAVECWGDDGTTGHECLPKPDYCDLAFFAAVDAYRAASSEQETPTCNCVLEGCHAGCPAAAHDDLEGTPCDCIVCHERDPEASEQDAPCACKPNMSGYTIHECGKASEQETPLCDHDPATFIGPYLETCPECAAEGFEASEQETTESGQTLAEYVIVLLVIAGIVGVVLWALAFLGPSSDDTPPFHVAATAACEKHEAVRAFELDTRDTVLCEDGTVQDVEGW
jgi:hypothetical protein